MGDYASERGIVNAPCNGLMVNTIPIISKGQEELPKYKVQIDEYGYQYAGSYGGWNSKPGVQYVTYGRRPMAPFTFSRGGSPMSIHLQPLARLLLSGTSPKGKDDGYCIGESGRRAS
ncbi:MAG: hypothetical protein ACLVL2_10555 [Bacteroides cellulosilyticus]